MIPCVIRPVMVAAAVIRSNDKILISSRPEGKEHHGFWELPGGKINSNETPQACVVRELKEELNADVIPLDVILQNDVFCEKPIRIFFLRTILKNERNLHCREGQNFHWLKLSEINKYRILPPDIALISFLSISQKNNN